MESYQNLPVPSEDLSVAKTDRRSRVRDVSQRVEKTKRDIEALKSELQKLLDKNTNRKERKGSSDGESRAKPRSLSGSPPPEQSRTQAQAAKLRSKSVSSLKVSSSDASALKKRKSLPFKEPQPKERVSPKRVKHYDPEEAREYIRKQKLQRQGKRTDEGSQRKISQEAKQQRLRELHQKTIQLLSQATVKKNAIARSTVPKAQNIAQNNPKGAPASARSPSNKILFRPPSQSRDALKNQPTVVITAPLVLSSPPPRQAVSTDLAAAKQEEAAIKIQSAFRGFAQRKKFNEMRNLHDLCTNSRKLVAEITQKQNQPRQETMPAWLLPPQTLPYPYNFITAVKRKLQIAVQTKEDSPESRISPPVRPAKVRRPKQLEVPHLNGSVDLETYASHRRERNGKDLIKDKESLMKNPPSIVPTESDSDTTKNIPELSDDDIGDNDSKSARSNSHSKSATAGSDVASATEVTETAFSSRKINILGQKKTEKSTRSKETTLSTVRSELAIPFTNGHDSSPVPASSYRLKSSRSWTRTITDEFIADSFEHSYAPLSATMSNENETCDKAVERSADIRTNSVQQQSSLLQPEALKVPELKLSAATTTLTTLNKMQSNRKASRVPPEKDKNNLHIKFEAELHLLDSFNESLKHVIALEKTIAEYQNKKAFTTKDVQTSPRPVEDSKSSDQGLFLPNNPESERAISDYTAETPILNDAIETNENSSFLSVLSKSSSSTDEKAATESFVSTHSKISKVKLSHNTSVSTIPSSLDVSKVSFNTSINSTIITNENSFSAVPDNPVSHVSLQLFNELIRSEDSRLEHLKMLMKIREKALMDRTKGELAWLEIQKKQLKESGQTNEIPALKKKQRGLIIKLQQEKHEMHRLKHMQKVAAKERKIFLREQQNIIKQHLNTNNALLKIKKSTKFSKTKSGPLKAINHQDSVDSVSLKTSLSEEILTAPSHDSALEQTEVAAEKADRGEPVKSKPSLLDVDTLKKSLLMREEALRQRRKVAEELLQWHRKLTEEEQRVADLETAALSVALNGANETVTVKGEQLNRLYRNMTGRQDDRFEPEKQFRVSHAALDQFYDDVRQILKTDQKTAGEYSSDFEQPTEESPPEDTSSEAKSRLKSELEDAMKTLSSTIQSALTCYSVHSTEDILSLSPEEKPTETASEQLTSVEEIVEEEEAAVEEETVEEALEELAAEEEAVEEEAVQETVEEEEAVEEEAVEEEEVEEEAVEEEAVEEEAVEEEEAAAETSINLIEFSLVQADDSNPEQNVASDIVEEPNIPVEMSSETSTKDSQPTEIEEERRSFESSETSDDDLKVSEDSLQRVRQIVEEIKAFDNSLRLSKKVPEEIDTSDDSLRHVREIVEDIKSADSLMPEDTAIPEQIRSEVEPDKAPDLRSGMPEVVKEMIEVSEMPFKSCSDDENEAAKSLVEEIKPSATSFESAEDISVKLVVEAPQDNDSIEDDVELKDESDNETFNSEIKSLPKSPNTEDSIEKCPGIDMMDSLSEAKAGLFSILQEISEDISIDSINVKKDLGGQGDADITAGKEQPLIVSPKDAEDPEDLEDPEDTDLYNTDFESDKDGSSREELEDESSIVTEIEDSLGSDLNIELNAQPMSDESDADLPLNNNSAYSTLKLNEMNRKNSAEVVTNGGLEHVDVRERVTQILESSMASFDKSPRIQDIYTTTYDLSPDISEDDSLGSEVKDNSVSSSNSSSKGLYRNEAEELLRKQLEIEQEIKQLEQQEAGLPYVYLRKIPNKPPPPYKPPVSPESAVPTSSEQVCLLVSKLSSVLHDAHCRGALEDLQKPSDFSVDGVHTDVSTFMFDLCKEIAMDAYQPPEDLHDPVWLKAPQKLDPKSLRRLPDQEELECLLRTKAMEYLGFSAPSRRENFIVSWIKKKRDHVEKLLLIETQEEEAEWIDYGRAERVVQDMLVNDILSELVEDTIRVTSSILSVKDRTLSDDSVQGSRHQQQQIKTYL